MLRNKYCFTKSSLLFITKSDFVFSKFYGDWGALLVQTLSRISDGLPLFPTLYPSLLMANNPSFVALSFCRRQHNILQPL